MNSRPAIVIIGVGATLASAIRSGAQEVRLARVRVRTVPPSRKDARKRMAGGEWRWGTVVIYLTEHIPGISL